MILSLRARLLLTSLLLLPVLLGIAGFALESAFKKSQRASEEARLTSHFYLILAAAEIIEGNLWMPDQLTEPRFGQQNSGLYGFILDQNNQVIWRSASSNLLGTINSSTFSETEITPGLSFFSEKIAQDEALFFSLRDIEWEIGDQEDSTLPLRFIVAHSQNEYIAALSSYRKQLWQWLLLLTISLLVAQLIILRIGMAPLRAITRDIDSIKTGEKSKLQGKYPREIGPLTENLNKLLQSEQQQRQRYSNTLADLAHSLKTPLAVMQNTILDEKEGLQTDSTNTLREQLERMNQIVGHQLKRATSAQQSLSQQTTIIAPIAARIIDSLKKVYRDRDANIEMLLTPEMGWQCDERDIFEVLGNVLENAFKYGATKISIHAEQEQSMLTVYIDDNGNGISQSQQHVILQRGARADTATTGQGIGLSVCVDIVSSYGGSLDITSSPDGGARIQIALPC
ncbi:ATP-binding protein [Aurantivibrio plasticivorans]